MGIPFCESPGIVCIGWAVGFGFCGLIICVCWGSEEFVVVLASFFNAAERGKQVRSRKKCTNFGGGISSSKVVQG